jgi:hypothetical protein
MIIREGNQQKEEQSREQGTGYKERNRAFIKPSQDEGVDVSFERNKGYGQD